MAVGRAGLGPDGFLAIECDAADKPSVRHVGVSAGVERDSLGVAPESGYFDRMELFDGEQGGCKKCNRQQPARREHYLQNIT